MESNEVNSSFFPPPPARYKLFTNANIKLAERLKEDEQYGEIARHPFDPAKQKEILQDTHPANDELDQVDLRTLITPPNLDWIRENGGWTAFGDREPWPGKLAPASLEGMPKLYDPKMERKEALQALLNTLIHAYMELLDALANQGPTSLSTPAGPTTSKTDQIVSHIELAAFNIHGLCNELRPRQARETLKLIMRQQAREKRLKAARVIRTCEDLRSQLARLKTDPIVADDGNSDLPAPPAPSVSAPLPAEASQSATRPIGGYDYELLLATVRAKLHPNTS
ncbi:hypothetical protein PCANC_23412 [Puccinia coronata f. sp. avenae]|uniref:Mediator of RNA polymerase II transcription subunit 7 n=1 Tax=Puccinia coronata f. sp. avenae TaxID=200324 RepID=A0A2N5TVX8_9BASI|nr:hypothetical protein PCANC_23412 [Puccinia coronata f. sp. avenae]